jgi:hypothetical protein
MPYEREFAPRLGHVPAASSAAIQEAMTRWVIPAITADNSEIEKRLIPLAKIAPEESGPAPKFTFAFDGSDVEIPAREKYPSVTVLVFRTFGTTGAYCGEPVFGYVLGHGLCRFQG